MKLRTWLLLFFLFVQCKQWIGAQPNASKQLVRDTIRETIIYEYDTVYAAPDTLRLVDTLVHFLAPELKAKPLTETKPLPATYRWAMGVCFSSSLAGFPDRSPPMDSASLERVMNFGYHWQLEVGTEKWLYLFTVGWNPVQERIRFREQYFTTGNNVSGVYDSLLVTSSAVLDNDYDYLAVSLGLGRRWDTPRFSYICRASFGAGFLIRHRAKFPFNHQVDAEIPKSSIRTTDYAAAVYAGIAYKFSRRVSWLVSPYYQYSFARAGKHPYGNLQILGVHTGLILFL